MGKIPISLILSFYILIFINNNHTSQAICILIISNVVIFHSKQNFILQNVSLHQNFSLLLVPNANHLLIFKRLFILQYSITTILYGTVTCNSKFQVSMGYNPLHLEFAKRG